MSHHTNPVSVSPAPAASNLPVFHSRHESLDRLVEKIIQKQSQGNVTLAEVKRQVQSTLRGAASVMMLGKGRMRTPYPCRPINVKERQRSQRIRPEDEYCDQRAIQLAKQSQFHQILDRQISEKEKQLTEALNRDRNWDLMTIKAWKAQQAELTRKERSDKRKRTELRIQLERERKEDLMKRSLALVREQAEDRKLVQELSIKQAKEVQRQMLLHDKSELAMQINARESEKQKVRRWKTLEDDGKSDNRPILDFPKVGKQPSRYIRQHSVFPVNSQDPGQTSLQEKPSAKRIFDRKQAEKTQGQMEYRKALEVQMMERMERSKLEWKDQHDSGLRQSNVF